MRFYRNNKP